MSEVPLWECWKQVRCCWVRSEMKDLSACGFCVCNAGGVFPNLHRSNTITDLPTLETAQGQMDGFFSRLPDKCHQNRVASVGD